MKETILKVEGMMCAGCENRVKNALESITGIDNVSADHTSGTVKVTSSNEISKSAMIEVIEDIGFSVKED